MKILLLGEFSALHNNLKDGLTELGHDTIIAAHCDGFKKIASDIAFDAKYPYFVRTQEKIAPLVLLKKLCHFDIVQIMNPFLFYNPSFPFNLTFKLFIDNIIKNNRKVFLLAAGEDAYYWKYGKNSFRYSPFADYLKYDLQKDHSFLESTKAFKINEYVVNRVKGIIPIMYEYEHCYSAINKLLPTIPIPINIDKIKYSNNKPGKKLVVFHGLNRYGFKGTHYVEEAFSYLKKKYPNDLTLIIDGKMPLNKYLKVMKETNVVIDQLSSYSLGVNGIYALALGKVVLGGAEPESLRSLNITQSPVINLTPNAHSIIHAIEQLLENRKIIESISLQSRVFAEQVHSHKKIAKQYIETWTSVN